MFQHLHDLFLNSDILSTSTSLNDHDIHARPEGCEKPNCFQSLKIVSFCLDEIQHVAETHTFDEVNCLSLQYDSPQKLNKFWWFP